MQLYNLIVNKNTDVSRQVLNTSRILNKKDYNTKILLFHEIPISPCMQIVECEEKIGNMEGALKLKILESSCTGSRSNSRASSQIRGITHLLSFKVLVI